MSVAAKERDWKKRPYFGEFACFVCKRTVPTTNSAQRLCSDCRCDGWESLAAALDPAYDRMQWHDWGEVSLIVARLVGKGWDEHAH